MDADGLARKLRFAANSVRELELSARRTRKYLYELADEIEGRATGGRADASRESTRD